MVYLKLCCKMKYLIVKMKTEREESNVKVRNVINNRWFPIPMQVFTQGQWWSNLSTHKSQTAQCLERGVLTIWQSGQSYIGSISYISSKNCIFLGFFIIPGFENNKNIQNIILQISKNMQISVYFYSLSQNGKMN